MRGALVPHAPLLLPEVTSKPDDLRDIWDGLGRLNVSDEDLVVVVSPHTDATGVYTRLEGSLAGFGLPEVSGSWPTEAVDELGLPSIDGELDHGAFVPLRYLDLARPACAIGVKYATDVSAIVEAIMGLASDRAVFVLASAHTSACLTERAPLPYSFDAVRLESRFITGVETDCAAARDLAGSFGSVGRSCSATTLAIFGEMFSGVEGSVLAYGFPFGVGYPVVAAEIDV